jgi:hypothetical protein
MPKPWKKYLKKKIISDLPTLIFSRNETGTTGIFFTPNKLSLVGMQLPEKYKAKFDVSSEGHLLGI